MSKNKSRLRQRVLDVTGTWGVGVILVIAAFIAAYQFVKPAPPDHIVMATGEEGGAYRMYGERFADYLADEGITVELRETAGSVENIKLLGSDSGVDLAFVQGGLAENVATDKIVALGSLYLEPVWIFLNASTEFESLGDFVGKRLAVGAEGSGTRAVVSKVLTANGVNPGNTEFVDVLAGDLSDALTTGSVDAAFLITGPSSEYIEKLTALPNVRLVGVKRADAFIRRYPFLSKVNLPEGVLDLGNNFPPNNVETVALTAMLAANENLHPALVDLLLVAAGEIHGHHSLLSDAGTFPTSKFIDLPLNEEAERHYRRGPPFLMRFLPFWAATLVDRLWVMLLPLLGLAIPLIKLVPPAYRWRIRRRLLRIYSALEDIDPARNDISDEADRDARLAKLTELEHDPSIERLPREYTDDVYKLRRDIDLVRRRLSKIVQI